MRRTAIIIAMLAIMIPVVTGAEATYHDVPTGSTVNDVAIAADGGYMIAGTDEGRIICIQQDGTVLWNVSTGSAVTTVDIADSRGYVAAGTDRGDVILLGRNGEYYWTRSIAGPVRDLAFSGDGRALAVGGERIALYDYQGKENWNFSTVAAPPAAPQTIVSVAITQDGNYIAAGSDNGVIYFIGKRGNMIWQSLARGPVTAVDTNRDGSLIAVGSRDRALQVYGRPGMLSWVMPTVMPTGASILALALSEDGRFIVVGKEGGDVECYRPDEGLLWRDRIGGDVVTVDVSRRGEAAAAGTADGTIRLFGGESAMRWSFGAGAPVRAVALSENGDYLAAGAGDRALIFRTADPPMPARLEDPESTTPRPTPTLAGGEGAIVGLLAIGAAGAACRLRRR